MALQITMSSLPWKQWDRPVLSLVYAPAFAYLLLHFVGLWAPVSLWGVNVAVYYPGWTIALLFAIPVVAALAPLYFEAHHPPHRALPWLIAVLAVPALYLFRVRAHTLGDSFKWFAVLENALLKSRPFSEISWHNASLQILGLEFINFHQALDLVIHYIAYVAGRELLGWSPVDAYEWVSCAAGGAYLAVLWRIGGQLTESPLHRLALSLFLASLGTIQLFFGYAESYTLVTVLTAVYLSVALDSVHDERSLWWAGAVLTLAVLTHMLAISLVPSWLYLAWRDRRLGPLLRRRQIGVPLAALLFTCAIGGYLLFYRGLHLPLVGEVPGRYGLLSPRHWQNLGNELLLVGPFGALWGLLSLISRTPGTPMITFLGIAAAGSSALIYAHDLILAGRDWDLMSFPTLPLSRWGIQCLRNRLGDAALPMVGRWVLPIMIVHSGLWVGVNASEPRATARLEHLLHGPANQILHYKQWTLAYYYMEVEGSRFSEAARALATAIAVAPPDELNTPGERAFSYRKFYAIALARSGRHAEALPVIREIYQLQKDPYLNRNDLAVHQEWSKIAFIFAEDAAAHGDSAAARALWEESRVALTRVAEWMNQREPYVDLAVVQGRLGRHEEALRSRARGLDPTEDPIP
ncbi:MAG: hypothetical protein VX733_02305 [Candidatus Latescibacterota bacterium]|nr:hypothetical protein [Candidatus Latescibacterota bacterium]